MDTVIPLRKPRRRRRPAQAPTAPHHLVTLVCRGHEAPFEAWPVASRIAALVDRQCIWHGSRLLCWVLLPDRLLLLVAPGDDESLPQLVRRVKCVSAGITNAVARRRGPVWTAGFEVLPLATEAEARAVARGMLMQPVQAGLAAQPGDYPFWNTVWRPEGLVMPEGCAA